ncbi:MAG: universal stress protein [Alphaproteobacteria bacterium]|nr:universal stress protein [Alphaproteobacteria bacterium]
MPFKDILVHVPDPEFQTASLDVACSLAAAHEAHLVGVYVAPPMTVPGYVAPEAGSVAYQLHETWSTESREKAEASFRDAADRAGIAAEWRGEDGHAGDAISLQARYADVAVVGQIDPDKAYPPGFGDLPEHVVLHAGRPTLVVPYAGSFERVGEKVVIAWDGSRESTRAIHDALPLLVGAKQTVVMAINPPKGPDGLGDLPGVAIAHELARHGVQVEVDEEYSGDVRVSAGVYNDVREDLRVGDILLARLSDLGADLLVMGGYGNSRLREFVLGGVTRQVFREMTVPVLISH